MQDNESGSSLYPVGESKRYKDDLIKLVRRKSL